MPRKSFIAALCVLALMTSAGAAAQAYDRTEIQMFHAVRRAPNALARYEYLVGLMPRLSADEKLVAGQYLSSALNELGVYNQAVLAFPMKSAQPPDLVLPSAANWESADALEVIARLAADRHIVMINEAHHDAHTRVLTLALLPRLRALGFKYFAAEALGNHDPGLMERGYPIKSSGTEYLGEPIYGEIVREAIRLGFVVVPYDSASDDMRVRDAEQAQNLYARVFARDPDARLFVDAGYAHVDKARGRLGDVDPMAMQLAKLTGIDPLSIDQTQFLETGSDHADAYHELMRQFPARGPEVLISRIDGKPWSAMPKNYDLNVLLPPALTRGAFGNEQMSVYGGAKLDNVENAGRLTTNAAALVVFDEFRRPAWLILGGQRRAFPINTGLCRELVPCAISAHYLDEPDAAPAADGYAFIKSYGRSTLFLRPGRYRLRAWDADGRTLSQRIIEVATRQDGEEKIPH
jgi:hypothetical protein